LSENLNDSADRGLDDRTGSLSSDPLYGGIDFSEGGPYTLEVRAIDDRDSVGTVQRDARWDVETPQPV
jgi:hypothetical protein